MGDIFIPPSLNAADTNLSIANSLATLLDPKERARIADDIKAHHALNESEKKKHDDALALIKQYQGILDETKRISEKNKADAEQLIKDRIKLSEDVEEQAKKLKEERDNLNLASQDAMTLHEKSLAIKAAAEAKEVELKKQKEFHAIEVQKVADKSLAAEATLKKAEEIKRRHTELLESIKAKQAAIAAFNL